MRFPLFLTITIAAVFMATTVSAQSKLSMHPSELKSKEKPGATSVPKSKKDFAVNKFGAKGDGVSDDTVTDPIGVRIPEASDLVTLRIEAIMAREHVPSENWAADDGD